MISPYHIAKNAIQKYKKTWKEVLLFSFILSLTGSLASLLLFIQNNNLLREIDSYKYIFTVAYILLIFNAFFVFINGIKFLLENKKKRLNQIFSNFKIKTVFNLLSLSFLLLLVFSLCYVFPNIILASIAEIVGEGLLNLLIFATSIIIMGIGVFIINYLNFSHITIIDEDENSFKKAISKSVHLVKGKWWSVFFNRATLIIVNIALSYLSIYIFVRIIPISWIETLVTSNVIPSGLIITYLLSVLIFSTILSFINLPYELSFYQLYKEAKKKE